MVRIKGRGNEIAHEIISQCSILQQKTNCVQANIYSTKYKAVTGMVPYSTKAKTYLPLNGAYKYILVLP